MEPKGLQFGSQRASPTRSQQKPQRQSQTPKPGEPLLKEVNQNEANVIRAKKTLVTAQPEHQRLEKLFLEAKATVEEATAMHVGAQADQENAVQAFAESQRKPVGPPEAEPAKDEDEEMAEPETLDEEELQDPEIKGLLEAQARAKAQFQRAAELRKKQQQTVNEAAEKTAIANTQAQNRKSALQEAVAKRRNVAAADAAATK